MKNSIKLTVLRILILSGVTFFISTCTKEPDTTKISRAKVSGLVQKGPFVNGTSIQMYELNSSLDQTGNVFNTQITNNRGSFEITDINLSSQYVQFSANGYYYNEILGEVSISLLNLNALSDISDISTVNVNILTHLEKARVEYLIDNGKDFAEAKETAQSEVLAIFSFELGDMDRSELLDVTVNKEENAILIAISLILQGNRSVGDLTELLANINTDIRQDGQLNDTIILTSLVSSAGDLDLDSVRLNLENRYNELGLSVTIPDFEEYIYDFIAQTGSAPTVSGIAVANVGLFDASLTGTVNAGGLATTVIFEYGTTTDYGYSIGADQNPVSGSSNTNVTANLTNLNPGTLYHYRIKATNFLGTSNSADSTFTTLGGAAEAMTEGHLYPSSDGALLSGFVKPPNGIQAVYYFEYGTAMNYGNRSEEHFISGNTFVQVNARISGLALETEYHYRIVALDISCLFPISYGEDKTFKTLNTITDIEGNIYKTVQLPDGIWMAENLKTSKYNNGDTIETTIPDTLSLMDSTVTKYQWAPNGDENNVDNLGRIYTGYVATDDRGICPTGWHIPSNEEWSVLITSFGGDSIAGGKLKDNGLMYWNNPQWNVNANNESGFTALPAGYRSPQGFFGWFGACASWWSSSEYSPETLGGYWVLQWDSIVHKNPGVDKRRGFSVRCIQDSK